MSKKKEIDLDMFLENAEDLTKKRTPKLAEIQTINSIDYNEYDITEDEKNKLIECEQNIAYHSKKTAQHILLFCESLYKANEIFSSHDKNKGYWRKWLQQVNIPSSSADIAIKRYKFYKQCDEKGLKDRENVLEMPARTLLSIASKEKDKFTESEIIEVVSADNSTKKLKEIKNKKQSEKLKNKTEEKIYLKKLKVKKIKMIEKLKQEVKEINEKLQNL